MTINPKRVTVFCGHYGSGKTNVAVNYALAMSRMGLKTALADIDIVNPYFRSADSKRELEENGVRVVSLPFANTNVDLPALPSSVYGLVETREEHAVFDVGGDDRGVYALGRFSDYILEENDFDMLCVVNFCRPLTLTAEDALEVMREIDVANKLPFTGLVNNTNIGDSTNAEVVAKGLEESKRLSEMTGLPVAFSCVSDMADVSGDFFRLRLQEKYF